MRFLQAQYRTHLGRSQTSAHVSPYIPESLTLLPAHGHLCTFPPWGEPAEVTECSHPAVFLQGVAFRFRTAPAKAAVFCLKTGTFSNGFALREAMLIAERRWQLEVCYFLECPDRIPQNSFCRLNFLEKECSLPVYMWVAWGGTCMTSVLPLYVLWTTAFVILLSVGPVLFYFLMKREHKEKGASLSWPNLAGAKFFLSISTATSVENSQAWWFVTAVFGFPVIPVYIAHDQSHTSSHSSLGGITLCSAQVVYPWSKGMARTSRHFGLLLNFLSDSGRLYTLLSPLFSKMKNYWLLAFLIRLRSELDAKFCSSWYCATLLQSPQAEC